MPLSTFLMQIAVVITYLSLSRDPYRKAKDHWLNKFDLVLCIAGCIALCGFFMVGAVSEDNDALVHVIGAVSGFWGMWLYCVLLTARFYHARERLKIARADARRSLACVLIATVRCVRVLWRSFAQSGRSGSKWPVSSAPAAR